MATYKPFLVYEVNATHSPVSGQEIWMAFSSKDSPAQRTMHERVESRGQDGGS